MMGKDRDPVVWGIALFLVGASAAGLLLRPNRLVVKEPDPPGWTALEPCSVLTSFAGDKLLTLDRSSQATLNVWPEPQAQGKRETVTGRWEFNHLDGSYRFEVGDISTVYTLVFLEHSNLCIMVKGDAGAADLRASWFATESDSYDPGDPDW